ncbi:MAG: low molecular weight protein-tyrosine-phosphatase, partial [Eubacteriales bacterium]|nr:low molecular weight protein-tyrosine-phosphatase [Eubacteriales bacterium]
VCHGNICRSPMAEFLMKDLVKKAGLADRFYIESAATSSEEIWGGQGNPVYRPAAQKLRENGISCAGKRAQQMSRSDYRKYDLLIGMDSANIRNMHRICGGDPDGKIRKLLDYTERGGDVADPWYTRDYETAWQDIREGCTALLAALCAGEQV